MIIEFKAYSYLFWLIPAILTLLWLVQSQGIFFHALYVLEATLPNAYVNEISCFNLVDEIRKNTLLLMENYQPKTTFLPHTYD
jgi:hypothetical protein